MRVLRVVDPKSLNAGQVPAHRVLFCSTLEGKVSIVRQLEPELHIDGHHQTVHRHCVLTYLYLFTLSSFDIDVLYLIDNYICN